MAWPVACRALALLLLSASVAASESSSPHVQLVTLEAPAGPYRMAVYSNRDLSGDLSDTRSVVTVQHGLNRNGAGYFETVATLLPQAGASQSVLVIAPQFMSAGDARPGELARVPRWSASGWMGGYDARDLPVSALDVYDQLLVWLSDRRRFPRLARVVIAGHSAGGQLVQRYAALNRMDEKLREIGVSVSYVVANPSSYLYFTNERPGPSGFRALELKGCPGYDDYKYGFLNPARYVAQIDPGAALERYASRTVVYLFGSNDNDPNHRALDKSCAARAQGATRLERGLNYLSYLHHIAGDSVAHRAYEVARVGHNQRRMLQSVCGTEALIDKAAAPPGAAACRELQ